MAFVGDLGAVLVGSVLNQRPVERARRQRECFLCSETVTAVNDFSKY
jgi:hypothetical protein